jgi:uncharacterized protein YecT (DUF1311 family)
MKLGHRWFMTLTLSALIMGACQNSSSNANTNDQSLNETDETPEKTTENNSSEDSASSNDIQDNQDQAPEENNEQEDSGSGTKDGMKEKYLNDLNALKKEIEASQQNSDATTTPEMEEEESVRLNKWDVKLNEIYGVLTEQLPEKEMDQLREEQRNWIKQRDAQAKEASLKYEGGTMESLEYIATQASLTRERCFALVAAYMN